MDKFLSNSKSKVYYLPYMVFTAYMIYKFKSNHATDGVSLDLWLIRGNFIPLICNNAFFYARYKCMGVESSIRELSIIRVGEDAYESRLLKVAFINSSIYILLSHILLIIIFYAYIVNINILLISSIMYYVIFLLYECLYVYIILKNKNSALVIIPALLNLFIHYFIVLPNIY